MKKYNPNIIVFIVFIFGWQVAFSQLTINPGSSLTIKDGTRLYVGTNLYIKSSTSGSGHLADQNNSVYCNITGNVTVERYILRNGWHNAAAPINNASSSVFTGTDLVFYYDETIILNDWNFGWVWYSGSLSPMKGYDVHTSSPLLVNYTGSSGNNLNTGSYSIAVTRTNSANGETESHKGWNLVGNPYPSPVDWLKESGWNKSDINDAKYIWNPDNNNYTIFLGGTNPTGINGGTQFIPSNQGFWVQAVNTGTFEINNACRTGIMTATPDYYKNTNNLSDELRILASGNGYSDETMVRFLPSATDQFDINLDASKLFSSFDSIPQICTVVNNQHLAINSLEAITNDLSVNLAFFCKAEGKYTLTINDTCELLNNNQIYLMDVRKQKLINLNKKHCYSFYHSPEFSPKRFIILFNPSKKIIDSINPNSWFTVSSNGNTLTINRNTQKFYQANIYIYNIMGQQINSFPLSESSKSTYSIRAPQGYYIISIITSANIINTKILLSG